MTRQDADKMNKALQTLYEVCTKAQKTRSGCTNCPAKGKGKLCYREKYNVALHIIGGILKRRSNIMRWVTYYEDLMMSGKVSDVVIHKDKESATEFF